MTAATAAAAVAMLSEGHMAFLMQVRQRPLCFYATTANIVAAVVVAAVVVAAVVAVVVLENNSSNYNSNYNSN